MRPGAIAHLLLVFAVLGLTAAQPSPDKQVAKEPIGMSALVFTDVKFDDQTALHFLGQHEAYEKVVVVITGVEDTGKAHSVIKGFLDGVKIRNYDFESKFSVLVGQNPALKPAPHEATWDRIPNLPKVPSAPPYGPDTLTGPLHGRNVDVFQIAPVSHQDVSLLVDHDQPFFIDLFHITHGYNTLQFDAETGADLGRKMQADFVHNLQKRLRQHNSGRKAILLATDKTKDTWLGQDGGTQALAVLKEYFPEDYINAALWDPFTKQQFQGIANLAQQLHNPYLAWEINNSLLPKAWIEAWSDKGVADNLRSRQYEEDVMSAIQYARAYPDDPLGKELNNHYLDVTARLIQPFLRRVAKAPRPPPEVTVYFHRFGQGIVPMFSEGGAIETFDAAHVMAALESHLKKRIIPLNVLHPKGDTNQLAELKPSENPHPVSEYGVSEYGYKVKPLPKGWAQENFVKWIQKGGSWLRRLK
ncbi:hypothetical protein ACQY0O_006088 [Thecaphora frezii]